MMNILQKLKLCVSKIKFLLCCSHVTIKTRQARNASQRQEKKVKKK